jgi:hypothetical protein
MTISVASTRRWDRNMSDTELISTEDLIKELYNRFDDVIIAGLRIGYEGKKDIVIRHWKGSLTTCAGLASQIQHCVNEQQLKDTY